jgi:hypothetical protein
MEVVYIWIYFRETTAPYERKRERKRTAKKIIQLMQPVHLADGRC